MACGRRLGFTLVFWSIFHAVLGPEILTTPFRLGQPQVAWLNDEEDGRVNWVHLSTRLLVASIFVLVGEAGPRVVNPLIGGLLHYNELASSRHSGFIGLHSIGGGTHSLASMADTLAWLADPPVACVLGSVSNVGLLLHLPSRYGLEHCRVRLHRLEASVMGRTSELICYTAFVQNRSGSTHLPWFERRYLNARE